MRHIQFGLLQFKGIRQLRRRCRHLVDVFLFANFHGIKPAYIYILLMSTAHQKEEEKTHSNAIKQWKNNMQSACLALNGCNISTHSFVRITRFISLFNNSQLFSISHIQLQRQENLKTKIIAIKLLPCTDFAK